MVEQLGFAIRTPHEQVLDAAVRSVRVPTESGLVGLRPRQEPLILLVEAGLIVVELDSGRRFAATAGGLLQADRERAVLYTPFAVLGDQAEVLSALERTLATPDSELGARRRLGELERRIVSELRPPIRPTQTGGGA